MPETLITDVLVIGGGPAGYEAAAHLGKKGKKVILADNRPEGLGGTCLNEGCIPVKSILESALLFHKMKNAHKFGLPGVEIRPDFTEVRKAARKNSDLLQLGIKAMLKQGNVQVMNGHAVFTSPETALISNHEGGTAVQFTHALIAAGSRSSSIKGLETDGLTVLSSRDFLELPVLPESLVIIGGGVIGCEIATLCRLFDVKTAVVEMQSQLIPGEDSESIRSLTREWTKNGLEILTGSKVLSMHRHKNGVTVHVETPDGSKDLAASHVLVSVGRVPATDNLGLDLAGVEITTRGHIAADLHFRTTNPRIYAAGDVLATPQYAHTAYAEGRAAAHFILGGLENAPNPLVPRVIFTEPAFAAIGLSEETAREQGREFRVVRSYFKANGKAVIQKEEAGMVKLLVSPDNLILGGSITGPSAYELIHILSMAMENNIRGRKAAGVMFAHPTLAETLGLALSMA